MPTFTYNGGTVFTAAPENLDIATQSELDAVAAAKQDAATAATDAELAAHAAEVSHTNARTPTGAAGGVLSGTFPAPGFAADMATQAELDAVAAAAAAVGHTHTQADVTGLVAVLDSTPIRVPKVAGLYYGPFGTLTAVTLTAGFTIAVPFWVQAAFPIARIGINVTTLAAGSSIRLGVYTTTGAMPGVLHLDAGTVDSTGGGAKEITGLASTLPVGLLWFAALATGGNPAVTGFTAGPAVGYSSLAAAALGRGPGVASAAGQTGLASPFPTPVSSTTAPNVVVRAA